MSESKDIRVAGRHRIRAGLSALAVAAVGVLPGAHAAAAETAVARTGDERTTCRLVQVPVRAGTESGRVSGTLCEPPGATRVQLLVPGWTYNRHYWETPPLPGELSYVQSASRAGYATLAIDRLGTGASLQPLAIYDTHEADLAAVDTVARALRDGSLGTRSRRSSRIWATTPTPLSACPDAATSPAATRGSPSSGSTRST